MLRTIIYILFSLSSLYGAYYLITASGILKRKKKKVIKEDKYNNFAIIIAARNEENVIANLVKSLKKQKYPKEHYNIYVIANNCTDSTSEVAKNAGATVIECTDKVKSKGDVLKFTFNHFKDSKDIDAYVIFDADNLVHPEFLSKMNETINEGYTVAQGFRETKNVEDNWLSCSYAMLYYLQNYFLNKSRYNLGKSSFLNGTGFMVKKSVIDEHGFNPKTVTEDIEFTAMCAINGEKIAFVEEAITYDEQVNNLKVSLKQRKRWSYGTIQCLRAYFNELLKTGFKSHSFECFDIILFYSSIILHVVFSSVPLLILVYDIVNFKSINEYFIIYNIVSIIIGYLFGVIFRMLLIKKCNRSIIDNIGGILLFDLFILTWLPVNVICLFIKECKWDPIKHNRNIDIENA